ncbi:dipeptide/oligopeptide/nickel ABC transporter ATP-binding protein [Spirochaetia bacterium]|nr:dipeptide/oligopeptide/nickel ABC transporter ATP-binding protein [Spirochaetia bacterium]
MDAENILEVRNLRTYFKLDEGVLKAVDDVNFSIKTGKTLGIIGESGCGKSVTAHSILNTVQAPGKIHGGTIYYRTQVGTELEITAEKSNGEVMRSLRGREISMIFQEPMTSMSPVYSIGHQMTEAILVHEKKRDKTTVKTAQDKAVEMLNLVGMPNAIQRFNDYPHQLSGGMCQRAMIAMAISLNPSILIADEPTTALDVTVQAQIVDLMLKFQADLGMSILYITHDMGVIAETASDICVMYLGRVVEQASTEILFRNPVHPYTIRLLRSIPKLGKKIPGARLDAIKGNVPVPLNLPAECGFVSRCLEVKQGICDGGIPPMVEVESGHFVRCFLHSAREAD